LLLLLYVPDGSDVVHDRCGDGVLVVEATRVKRKKMYWMD
jgi:hypothetical protein